MRACLLTKSAGSVELRIVLPEYPLSAFWLSIF